MNEKEILETAKRLSATNGMMKEFYSKMIAMQTKDPGGYRRLMSTMEGYGFLNDQALIDYVCS